LVNRNVGEATTIEFTATLWLGEDRIHYGKNMSCTLAPTDQQLLEGLSPAIYEPMIRAVVLEKPELLSGGTGLPGFALKLAELW
jgi:hypothetical protein